MAPIRVSEDLAGVMGRLRAAEHRVWLTGESLHALLTERAPPGFEVLTTAPPETVLAVEPSAIPTRLEVWTVTRPARPAPVDVTTCRHPDAPCGDLSRRDFTVNAIAWDPDGDTWIDPFDGRRDIAEGRLRCPGSAGDRLRERPVRALRAARIFACLGLRPDAELEAALAELARDLPALPALEAKRELVRMLLAPDPSDAIRLLRRTGLEAALCPGAREDAAELMRRIELAPSLQLPMRLAIWLRGAVASDFLRRFRFGRARSGCVQRLLHHHPIENVLSSRTSDASLRRVFRQLDEEELAALMSLRAHERTLEGDGADTNDLLAELRARLERAREADRRRERRRALAIDGGGVMRALGCGPGPHVGQALRALAEWVDEDPTRNEPDALHAELRAWWARRTQ